MSDTPYLVSGVNMTKIDEMIDRLWENGGPTPRQVAAAFRAVLSMPPSEAMVEAGWDKIPFARGTETHRMAGGWNNDFSAESIYKAMRDVQMKELFDET